MIIGIDASRANKSNKTGTEWYSWHLIEELKKIAQSSDQFLLYTNDRLAGDLAKCPENFAEKVLAWPPKYLWTQVRLWWELLVSPPDVLLVPAHTIPLLPIRRKVKVAATVHDVGFKRFPELYKPIQVWYHDLTMRRIKSRANVIITISEFSKREMMELYGVKESQIKVVYLGYDEKTYNERSGENSKTAQEKYNLTSPYLLYVGRLEKKKNIGNIVAAFALAKDNFPDLKLVLAGSGGNQFEEIKKIIADLKLEDEIILPGYVAQEDLPGLVAGAEIFMFPTLYEGFGLPILEAMACGTPVITSDMLPHTEVGGSAGVYADPHSPQSLSDAIIKILENPEFKSSLQAKGLLRAKEFSWRQTAEGVYKSIKS
jgi:glycosyltransferase involved in cell wall biosynthesis